jgi:uncharacterized protein YdeI (YjbR/CyaY-like superfamily)
LIDESRTFYAKSRAEWRKWLEQNHQSEKLVWLVIPHKNSKLPGVSYEEAVEEALCFGWIDSKANRKDAESYYQLIAKRNPKSYWSQSNRQRVEKLIEQGLMTKAGLEAVELAKKTGTWTAMEKIQNAEIPEDLQRLFDQNKKAFENFQAFPTSSKQIILYWISSAKRPETRQKRIQDTVALAEKNIRANEFRQNKLKRKNKLRV